MITNYKKLISASIIIVAVIVQHIAMIKDLTSWLLWLYPMLFIVVLLIRNWSLFHFTLTLVLFTFLPLVLSASITNFSAVFLFIIFWIGYCITKITKPAQSTLEWFRIGKINKGTIILMVITSIISGVALILWGIYTNNIGIAVQFVQGLVAYPKILVFVFIVPVFAMLNAFSEEVIYRGIFQEALVQTFGNPYIAIFIQATVFAALHFAFGFPNGATGYAMTFIYGFILGYIRHRSAGILAPYIVHVFADIIIAYFLLYKAFAL